MKKLRVTHVVPDLGIGGIPKVVEMLCLSADQSRILPNVLCLNYLGPTASRLVQMGVAVLGPVARGRTPDRLIIARTARWLRQIGPDVVHTHNTQAFIEGGIAAKMSGFRPFVHTDHGRRYPDRAAYLIAERALASIAHRVVAVSAETAEDLTKFQGIPSRRITVITNGVQPVQRLTPVQRDALRSQLGLAPAEQVIGIVARLVEEKGIEHLLAAVRLLRQSMGRIKLLIVGDGHLRPSLEALARALEVDDVVIFLGSRTDVHELLSCLDVFVLSSVSEGTPMAILEAMAAGLPIVATAVGGVPKLITDRVNGVLVAPANPESLARSLHSVLSDAHIARKLGETALKDFSREYTASAMAARYEVLYRSAVA